MSNLSPKAEPIAWGTIVSLILATLASYGYGVTPELEEALVFLVPLVAGLIWARQTAYAPDTMQEVKQASYVKGLNDATPEPQRMSTKPSTGVRRSTNVGR